jgi:UDP-N-acetylenolpyruvoylglucosamine reductase
MTSSDIVSIAALISVKLRRETNRTIDVKWLVTNEVYAKEIIRLCREQSMNELTEYANHLEKLMFGAGSNQILSDKPKPTLIEAVTKKDDFNYEDDESEQDELDGKLDPSKYIGGLR